MIFTEALSIIRDPKKTADIADTYSLNSVIVSSALAFYILSVISTLIYYTFYSSLVSSAITFSVGVKEGIIGHLVLYAISCGVSIIVNLIFLVFWIIGLYLSFFISKVILVNLFKWDSAEFERYFKGFLVILMALWLALSIAGFPLALLAIIPVIGFISEIIFVILALVMGVSVFILPALTNNPERNWESGKVYIILGTNILSNLIIWLLTVCFLTLLIFGCGLIQAIIGNASFQ